MKLNIFILLIFTFFIIFLSAILLSKNKSNKKNKNKNILCQKNKKIQNLEFYQKMNDSLQKTHTFLNTYCQDHKWFLSDGLLISALRYGDTCYEFEKLGIYCNDNDIDIYIQVNSKEDWINLYNKFKEYFSDYNLFVKPNFDEYPAFQTARKDYKVNILYETTILLDIMPYYVENNQIIYGFPTSKWSSQEYVKNYSKDIIYDQEIVKNNQMSKVLLGNLIFQAPYDTHRFLEKQRNYLYSKSYPLEYPVGGWIFMKNEIKHFYNKDVETYINVELTDNDKKTLKKIQKKLYDCGYASFYNYKRDTKLPKIQ